MVTITDEDKNGLMERTARLGINPDALDKVEVPSINLTIPNQDGKRVSLQIYAALTSADGHITVEESKRGLAVYGEKYVADAHETPGKHPAIDGLEAVIKSGKKARSNVYRRESFPMHPFTDEVMAEAFARFGRVILYDEATIRGKMRALNNAFSPSSNFINHIAVKTTDCAPIIEMAIQEGMGLDCASYEELRMAEEMGIDPSKIILTSNATPASLYKKAKNMRVIINFDDITHIPFFLERVGELPETVFFRYNPGDRMPGGNEIIGTPGEQKYGMMYDHTFRAIRALQKAGVKRFGLQKMIVSNELDAKNLIVSANDLVDLGLALQKDTTMEFDGFDFGGGLGINYRPEQRPIDEKAVARGIESHVQKRISQDGLNPNITLRMENGRWLTGDSAVLLMEVLHVEDKPAGRYVKVDASGNDFARPEAYGCYQHMVVVGKRGNLQEYFVAGPKCENSDHFAKNRLLPEVERGNILALCGAGAHGHMMGSPYNGHLPCGEAMLTIDKELIMLTRRRTLRDHFSKYDFPGSKFSHLARVND